jgi:hypothetical protein
VKRTKFKVAILLATAAITAACLTTITPGSTAFAARDYTSAFTHCGRNGIAVYRGQNNDCVRAVQWSLRKFHQYSGIGIDGSYGPETAKYVRLFALRVGVDYPTGNTVNHKLARQIARYCDNPGKLSCSWQYAPA